MFDLKAPPGCLKGGAFFFTGNFGRRRRPSKKTKIIFPILFLFGFFSAHLFSVDPPSRKNITNVLLLTIDTLRPDRLSCYSDEHLSTPHIDSLAERGTVFTRAFAHTPMTLPSHANIFLGSTPLYHGVHDNSHFIVADEFLTLAEFLKNHGFNTGAFVGAFPLDSRFGLDQGFDVYDDNYGFSSQQEFSYVERKAEVVIERAVDWIENQGNPWFCWIHCFDPHQRYQPPPPFDKKYSSFPYDGEVAYVDESIGKLIAFLKGNGQFDRTLVVFTGDHGESLGEHGEPTHGYFAYNSTLWVPLIVANTGVRPGRVTQNACHTDIFPTICDVLDLEKPDFLQGMSLLAAAKGKKIPSRSIYFESLYANLSRGWAPLTGFIEGSTKFMNSPIPELYDLERDFCETSNLAKSENIEVHKKKLDEICVRLSFEAGGSNTGHQDRETLKKLESLGYLSGFLASSGKKEYTPEDDLKTLLPYQIQLQEAIQAYNGGRFEEGINLLKKIIAERKDFDQAFTHLATLYKEQGNMRQALEILKKGFEENPTNDRILGAFGISLVEAGHYDAAIEKLENALALIDCDPDLWIYLGVAYWSKKEFGLAEKAYQKALALDSNSPIIFNNLGSLSLSRAKSSKTKTDLHNAIRYFKTAIELDPNYASAYNGLGTAYGMAGDRDAAIACWKKAIDLKPDFGYPLYNLGLTFLEEGQKDLALVYLEDYKKYHYRSISSLEREKLDELIDLCRLKDDSFPD
jgi:arylsulfatase A-like enzyme/Flp pilus assembly protein TadD